MREYAKDRKIVQEPTPSSASAKNSPGMSNQSMLTMLGASEHQSVSCEEAIKQRLTERFGVGFDGLQVTKDPALETLQERAYTKGNEIHLAPDVDFNTDEGSRILMHEGAHVIQQGSASLGSGILSSDSLEEQANEVAYGSTQMDVSGFSMPSAAGAPVQGFLDFLFNRERYRQSRDQRKAARYAEHIDEPEQVSEIDSQLRGRGLGGKAVYSPQRHRAIHNTAVRQNKRPPKPGATFEQLERETLALPRVRRPDGQETGGDITLHGISQES